MTQTREEVRNMLIAGAKDLPDLISAAVAEDPELAKILQGKLMTPTTSTVGMLASGLVSYAVAKYGLGWDHDTDMIVSGSLALVFNFVIHWARVKIAIGDISAPAGASK